MYAAGEAVEPWKFGWDALVAIGTFVLAAATFALAFLTRGVAKAASDEVRSQNRPVLVPATKSRQPIRVLPQSIQIRLRNGGQGPAFGIQCSLLPDRSTPDIWHHGILEPDQEVLLRFPPTDGEPHETYELKADYTDLAGQPHSSTLTVKRVAVRRGEELRSVYAFLQVSTN